MELMAHGTFCYVLAFDKHEGPFTPELQEEKLISKRKMLGNIKFIGMLFLNRFSISLNKLNVASMLGHIKKSGKGNTSDRK